MKLNFCHVRLGAKPLLKSVCWMLLLLQITQHKLVTFSSTTTLLGIEAEVFFWLVKLQK